MSSKTPIFFIGATGFIGGSVLQAILAHPKANSFELTALIRIEAKAKALESTLDIKTVIGSLQDYALLAENAEKAHIIFQIADCDDEGPMKAILAGLKARHEKTGDKPILIHTSGTGLLADDSRGEYTSPTITSDLDLTALASLPPSALHHSVDLLVNGADTDGYATTYIMLPGIVWGRPTGPLFDGPAPISRGNMLQLTWIAAPYVQRGRPGVVGKAAGRWPNVHIDDNADAFFRLFDAALFDPARVSHGPEGYFFAVGGEHGTDELVRAAGEALAGLGLVSEATPDVFTAEERAKYFGSDTLRKEVGWAPKHTTDEFIKSIGEEVEDFAKTLKA
uniref:G protein beta subunit (G protein beta subunit 1) n=1 Tax=Ganoderma boninense TaxID=34458 RepID=A0A5K1K611_9APHY|nr:G protein beta subunit (G protein beta subunit 1) [Ganoderma boninense]